MAGPYTTNSDKNYVGLGLQSSKGTGVPPTLFAPFRGQATDGAAKAPAAGDSVTISPAAEAALNATQSSGVRQDVVNRIRSEIAAGTYETPAKLDVALDRLIDEIG